MENAIVLIPLIRSYRSNSKAVNRVYLHDEPVLIPLIRSYRSNAEKGKAI